MVLPDLLPAPCLRAQSSGMSLVEQKHLVSKRFRGTVSKGFKLILSLYHVYYILLAKKFE
jgi:hypothetical protein